MNTEWNIGRFQDVEFAGADVSNEVSWYFDPDEIKVRFSGTADAGLRDQIDSAIDELCEKHGVDSFAIIDRILSISTFRIGETMETICHVELYALSSPALPRMWHKADIPVCLTSEEAGGLANLIANACVERLQFLMDWDGGEAPDADGEAPEEKMPEADARGEMDEKRYESLMECIMRHVREGCEEYYNF